MAKQPVTQDQLDEAYEQGKAAFRRDFGSHGPTLRVLPVTRTPNPHTGLIGEAWKRGYQQDVRRVAV